VPERSYSVVLAARVDAYVAAMNRAKQASQQFSSETEANLKKVGGQMQSVGSKMTARVTLPIVAAGGAALKMGYDFDKAFTRMVSLAGVAASEVDGLKEAVLELSGETAVAPAELAAALYEASSAGLDTEQALDAVRKAAKASAAGMGSAADVVGLVASATASYGAGVIDAAEATDVLTAAIREGRADPQELAGTLGRILPFASQLGVTFGEVGGTVAYLSNVFGDTNRTVTAMSGLFAKLLSPTAQGRETLEQMGTSVEELHAAIDERGLLGALDLLRERGFAGNQQALTKLFDDIEGRQAAMALLADNSGTLAETLDTVANSAGAADDAFSTWESSDSADLAKGLNDLRVAAVRIGETLLPIAADVTGAFADLASGFSNLPGPVQTGVLALAGVTAVAGPLIWAAGSIIRNLGAIRTASGSMTNRLVTSTGQLTRLGTAASVAGGALAGFGVAMATLQIIDSFRDNVGDTTSELQHFQATAGSTGTDLYPMLDAFTQLAEAKFDNADSWSKGMDLVSTGFDQGRINAEGMNKAFEEVLATSPAQAQQLIDAMWELSGAVNSGNEDAAAFAEYWGINGEIVRGWQNRVDDAVGSQDALTASTGEAATGAEVYADAAGEAAAASEEAATTGSDLADELASVADAYDTVRAASDRYRDALSMAIDPQRDLVEANERLYESMDALKEANEENGDSLDIASEKGRANRDLVKGQVDAILEYGPAARAMGKSAFDAALDQEGMRQSLLGTLEALGFNRVEAEEYIATLGLTPDSLATSVTLENQLATEEQIKGILEDLGEIDEGAAAEIEALVQMGQLDQALAKVLLLQQQMGKGASMPLRTYNAGGGVTVMAKGDVVDRPTLALFGEAGAEVVLPLTNPARMAQLLNDPRVRAQALAALGIPGFANGGIIGGMFPPSSGIITSNYAQFLRPVTSAGGGGDPLAAADELHRNKNEVGAISDADYRNYLASRLDDFEQYSSEWMQVWRGIKELDDEEARRQQDKVKAAEDAAAAQVAAEDQRMAAMYELGEIDRAQYEAYLGQRMGSFEKYSTDWMTRWRELSDLHAQAQREEQERQQRDAEAALRRLEILYDRAEARQQLAVAERDLSEAWADLGEAQWQRGTAETDEERARGDQQITDALNRVADQAFAGAKARARASGLQEGTAEWARFVRAEIGNYAAAHPELAGRLNEWLLGVPQFATGAYVSGRPGGVLANIAERGQGEWVLPDAKLMAFARTVQLSALSSTSPAAMAVDVRVFVGDREITDIVRTEVVRHDNEGAAIIRAGRRN
jgi:TP901 family phage tail tape measure protein